MKSDSNWYIERGGVFMLNEMPEVHREDNDEK